MRVDSQNALEERQSEIRDLVAQDDLMRVRKRLLDFERDFGRGTLKNDAIILTRRLSSLSKDELSLGASAELEAKRNQIIRSILELVDQIVTERKEPFRGVKVPETFPPEEPEEATKARDRELEAEREQARRLAELQKERDAAEKLIAAARAEREAAEAAKAKAEEAERKAVAAKEAARKTTVAAREELQRAAEKALREQEAAKRALAEVDRRAAEAEAARARAEEERREIERAGRRAVEARGTRGVPTGANDRRLPAVRCSGIERDFSGASHRFHLGQIDLELFAGEIIGLVGENGSGKTTLIRILAGELSCTRGRVEYPAIPVEAGVIRNHIAHVRQRPDRWYGKLKDNLHLAASMRGITGAANEYEVDFFMYRLGLEKYQDAAWSEISGGYQMRFELAKALVWGPKLLLLDEPLAPLDINAQQVFLQDLRDLASSLSRPLPVLVSSQHIYEIESIADRMLFLADGDKRFYGRLDDLYETRTSNAFEVTCDASAERLRDALEDVHALDVQDEGLSCLVFTDKTVSAMEVLDALARSGIAVTYFRDISRSTRREFRTFRGDVA